MASLSGLSRVKILLAVLANSRPLARPFALGLLKLLAPGSRVSYQYKIGNTKLIGFLRWKHIDSDLQSALELAIDDRYQLNQIPQPDFIVDGGANTGLFSLAASAALISSEDFCKFSTLAEIVSSMSTKGSRPSLSYG